MVKKIILVFKTHFDIGFTDLAKNVVHSYGSDMLREVIETCKATENLGPLRYVWTMPAWPLWHICNSCDPALKPDLDRLIENGQIVWHALPFTTHTDFGAPEEYAETFRYSRELAQRYGKTMPISAKMTDVPGHGLMLPQLLSQAGVRFLHLGCNEFATPPDVPGLFYWQVPGGGKVLTMYSKGGYGTGLLPPKDWPYPVWMAMMHTHDNCGPQSAELIQKMAQKARAAYPNAEIVCGTMDDFCRELEQCDLSGVPVIQKDLADTWIHGIGSYPAEVSQMRRCRERARRLHGIYFAERIAGKATSPELESLWDQYYDAVALFTEHTWGADVKTFLGPDRVYEKEDFLQAKKTPAYRFMEESWQEQRARAVQAKACLDQIEALLGGGSVEAGQKHCSLRSESSGNLVTVANHCYRLVLDTQTGRIRSLQDAKTGEVLLSEGALAYRYDRYGLEDVTEFLRSYGYHFTTWGIQDYGRENYPDCGHEVYMPEFAGWTISGRSLILAYRTGISNRDYGDAGNIRLTVTFPEHGRNLEISLELENKAETPLIESGSLVFPFYGPVQYKIGKPGGVIDPAQDIARLCNHALFNLERHVTVQTGQGTLSICSMDAPLFGIGSPGVYEYRKEFGSHREPAIYFDLFNNMWGTNFPQWIGGDHCYRFVLGRNIPDPQIWAAALCRGVTEMIPDGMELLETRVQGEGLYVALRDLTGLEELREFSVPGFSVSQTDILRSPVTQWENAAAFHTIPWGIHVFALKKKEE